MIRICTFLLFAAIALGVTPAAAETILLKDGSRMSGKIVGADAEAFQFETPDGILTIRRERIESIDYRGSSAELPSTPVEESPVPPVTPVDDSAASPSTSVDDSPVSEVVPAVFVAPAPTPNVWLPESQTPSATGVSPYFAGGYRTSNDEANGGFSGELGILNQMSPAVFLGGSLGVTHFNNKVGWWISKGNVTLVPAMMRLVLRQRAGLSFGAGLGYAFATHSLSSEVEAAVASLGLGLKEKVKGALNAEASLGYTVVSGAKLSGGVQVGYQFLKPKNEITVSELSSGASVTLTGDLDFSTPFIRGFVSF